MPDSWGAKRATRRRMLLATGAGTVGLVGGIPSVGAQDGGVSEDAYGDILAETDGSGTADDPHVITTVEELQATGAAPEAQFELGTDIDASVTQNWNPTSEIRGAYLGRARSGPDAYEDDETPVETYELMYGPIVEGSETLYFADEFAYDDGREIPADKYDLEYDARTVEIQADQLDTSGETYFVTFRADYDLEETRFKGFDPIGGRDSSFSGTFDGRGNEISNFHIHRGDQWEAGLFGRTEEAVLEGIRLTNADVQGGGSVGGLVGTGGAEITRAAVEGRVRSALKTNGVVSTHVCGGLAGIATSPIRRSSASITCSGARAGGLVGTTTGDVSNCFVEGNVQGTYRTGGILGLLNGSLTDSYANVQLDGESTVGGVAGSVKVLFSADNNATLDSCYATGTVAGTESVGGLAGSVDDDAAITDAYTTADVTGDSEVGGIIGTTAGRDGFTMANVYSGSKVSGEDGVGGIIGRHGSRSITVSNAYYDVAKSGIESAVGTGAPLDDARYGTGLGTVAETPPAGTMTGADARNNMDGFDFDTVWRVESSDAYPRLRTLSKLFDLESVSVDAESSGEGTTVTVVVTVANTGSVAATQEIRLSVDGDAVDSRNQTIEPGSERRLRFDDIDVSGSTAGEIDYLVTAGSERRRGVASVPQPSTKTPDVDQGTPADTAEGDGGGAVAVRSLAGVGGIAALLRWLAGRRASDC